MNCYAKLIGRKQKASHGITQKNTEFLFIQLFSKACQVPHVEPVEALFVGRRLAGWRLGSVW